MLNKEKIKCGLLRTEEFPEGLDPLINEVDIEIQPLVGEAVSASLFGACMMDIMNNQSLTDPKSNLVGFVILTSIRAFILGYMERVKEQEIAELERIVRSTNE